MQPSRSWKTLAILSMLGLAVMVPVIGSAYWSLETGTKAVRSGDYLGGARALESAAHKLPWRLDLWETAGMLANAGGDDLYAAQLLQAAKSRNSLTARGWAVLGTSLRAAGLSEAAVSAWLEGSKKYPQDAELLDRLAGAYHEQADYVAEQAALVERLAIADDAAARYRLGLLLMFTDAEGATAALDRANALNPDVKSAASTLKAALAGTSATVDPAGRMVVIGRSLGLVEEWALAARAFRLAVEADATNSEARAWLGEALQHLDRDGRPDLDAALLLGPNSSIVHTLRGLYWRRQGSLEMSLAEYVRAAALEPQNPALQSLVGEAYAASGDLVSALDAYQNAVELDPSESAYWRLLALFCADNGVQVLDVGVAAGLKAVELAPSDARALDALGWSYAQAGYLIKAEQSLLQALEENPSFASAHVHLGLTYLRWGQNELALEHWNEAVRLDRDGSAGQLASQLLHQYFPQP